VPAGYFRNSKKESKEIQLIKAYQLKELLMPFVSSLRKQTATVSKQSFQKIKSTG
jgi:hypothetical protein